MMTSGAWDGQDHHMGGAAPEDDFGQFLDMSGMGNDMQFDFNGFQTNGQREQQDALMGDSTNAQMMPQGPPQQMMHNQTPMTTAGGQHHQNPQMMPTSAPGTGPDAISSIDAQIQYLQQQKFQQQQRELQQQRNTYFTHNHSVPPTPQSLEMPPGSGHFYTHEQSYDRNYRHQQRMKEHQDMAFTPLVSPAVTPLDPHFNMENAFTVPGAYFSPLTSPALHAQNDSGSGYDHSTHSNNSPVEMDLETGPPATVASSLELSKKARKNNAAKSRSKPSVRSSPISKPQRKKAGPSPAIMSHVLSEVDETNHNQQPDSNMLPLPAASTDSEDASVSPENLTDMPPPPVPTWRASKSPYIPAQNGNVPDLNATPGLSSQQTTPMAGPNDDLPPPATPASLMRLPSSKSKRAGSHQPELDQTATDNIESLELPESVSTKQFAPIDISASQRESRIEPTSARSTSSRPLPSPSFRRPGTSSATASPQIMPGSSGPSAKRTPNLAPRTSRKGSVQVSPALLPRISPNLKPLLPQGGTDNAEADASRLLMSKSNYQNILEGNTVPGVTYPSELSSNLTSKRTSHKIAEQGRRNRINSALTIMADLLPEGTKIGSGEDSDKKDGNKQANASNSKASVVEQAITHMQHLQSENMGLKKEMEELKSQLDKLKAPS